MRTLLQCKDSLAQRPQATEHNSSETEETGGGGDGWGGVGMEAVLRDLSGVLGSWWGRGGAGWVGGGGMYEKVWGELSRWYYVNVAARVCQPYAATVRHRRVPGCILFSFLFYFECGGAGVSTVCSGGIVAA